jgi:excisionase family DNA binding protein
VATNNPHLLTSSELLTLPEAAELLRLKPSTLRKWILKRRLHYVKLGARVFIRRSDIDALISRSVIPAQLQKPPSTADVHGLKLTKSEQRVPNPLLDSVAEGLRSTAASAIKGGSPNPHPAEVLQ